MGVKYYQVGGAVRDKFLGQVSKDIDYVVEVELNRNQNRDKLHGKFA